MRALFAATLIIGFFAAPGIASGQTPDRLTCGGYPESRQFVDAQAWWSLPGASPSHAHLGACIPEREAHTGDIRFDVRLVMHDMPAAAVYRYLAFVVKGPGYEKTVASFNPDFRCAVGVRTCEKWMTYTLPLSSFSKSGLQEIRLRGSVSPVDGNSLRPSINWVTWVWNGKTRDDQTRMPFLRGKSWYGEDRFFGYCEPGYRSDLTALPDGPVTSAWAPRLRLVDHADGDVPPTWTTVRVDPDFHAMPPNEGQLLRTGAGGWEGTLTPAAGLQPGQHKLFMRADCQDERGTNAGVLIVPFTIAGDGSTPTPTPTPTPTATPTRVAMTSPADGATVQGTVLFNASVPSGTTRVGYLINGREVAYDATAADFSEHWSSAGVPNGRYSVSAVAMVGGAPVESPAITINVSN